MGNTNRPHQLLLLLLLLVLYHIGEEQSLDTKDGFAHKREAAAVANTAAAAAAAEEEKVTGGTGGSTSGGGGRGGSTSSGGGSSGDDRGSGSGYGSAIPTLGAAAGSNHPKNDGGYRSHKSDAASSFSMRIMLAAIALPLLLVHITTITSLA